MGDEWTGQDYVLNDFDHLLIRLREQKPNDRSDHDRYWAIVITEVEKARAVFLTYAYENTVRHDAP